MFTYGDGMLSKKLIFAHQAGPGPFDASELDFLRSMFDNENLEAASIEGDYSSEGKYSGKIRRSSIFWLNPDIVEKYKCEELMYKLSDAIEVENQKAFGFDLMIFEPPQMTRYEGSQRGHYHWHSDCNSVVEKVHRKLSWIIQLSDPSEYEGGDIGFMDFEGNKIYASDIDIRHRDRGTLITFPSFLPHTVTPVTNGVRHSMVGWCQGPRFR